MHAQRCRIPGLGLSYVLRETTFPGALSSWPDTTQPYVTVKGQLCSGDLGPAPWASTEVTSPCRVPPASSPANWVLGKETTAIRAESPPHLFPCTPPATGSSLPPAAAVCRAEPPSGLSPVCSVACRTAGKKADPPPARGRGRVGGLDQGSRSPLQPALPAPTAGAGRGAAPGKVRPC